MQVQGSARLADWAIRSRPNYSWQTFRHAGRVWRNAFALAVGSGDFSSWVADVRVGTKSSPDGPKVGLPPYPRKLTPSGYRATSVSCRYCCKSRKSNNPKNLAKVDLWTSLPLRRFSTPL